MLNLIIIAIALLTTSYLAFSPKLAAASNWQATITPLASIMGNDMNPNGNQPPESI